MWCRPGSNLRTLRGNQLKLEQLKLVHFSSDFKFDVITLGRISENEMFKFKEKRLNQEQECKIFL